MSHFPDFSAASPLPSNPEPDSRIMRWPTLGEVSCVVAAFLLSRALFSSAVLLSATLSVMPKNTAIMVGDLAGMIDPLSHTTFYTDSSWYMRVIHEGYPRTTDYLTEQTTLVFFPVYPLVVRVLGGSLAAGVLVSSLATLLGLLVLLQMTSAVADTADGRRAVLAACFFPAAHHLSGFRPEGLYFLLTISAFFFARERRWGAFAACGMLAAATRNTGFAVGVFALTPFVERQRVPTMREWWQVAVLALLPALGLLAFSAYEWSLTGNPFAWVSAQKAWSRSFTWPFAYIPDYFRNPFVVGHSGWDLAPLTFLALAMVVGGTAVLGTRRRWDLVAYIVVATMPFLTSSSMMGASRYVTVLFPVFMALAIAVDDIRFQYVLATFAFLLGVVGILVGQGVYAAQV